MRVVVNNIISLNPGDAAILAGTVQILESALGPETEVLTHDRHTADAARYYPWARIVGSVFAPDRHRGLLRWAERRGYSHRVVRFDAWRFGWMFRLLRSPFPFLARVLGSRYEAERLREYLEADLVVCSGGTYLVDYYDLQRPVLELELALGSGTPVICFPQSMGPFDRSPFRGRLATALGRCDRILVRDPRSQDHLVGLGIDADRIHIVPDAAFALAAGRVSEPDAPLGPDRTDGVEPAETSQPRRLAVSVREWKHFRSGNSEEMAERYVLGVAAAVERLVRAGHEVRFISTCQGIPEYWTDDSLFADEVAVRLHPDVRATVLIDRTFRQPEEIIDELATFDGVIATRMHAGILSLCAGTPVLGIAYEFKTRELLESMGLEDWVLDIEDIDPPSFAELAESFAAAAPALRSRVAGLGAEWRMRARDAGRHAREAIAEDREASVPANPTRS